MPTTRFAVLLGSIILAPIAWADEQCLSLPDAPMAAGTPAVPSPGADWANPQAAIPTSKPAQAPTLSAADDAATQIASSGIADMSPEEVARYPSLQYLVRTGSRLFLLGRSGGLPHVMAAKGPYFQPFVPLTDPNFVCGGMIMDASGHNITRGEETTIPGLLPPADRPPIRPVATPDEALAALSKASYGTLGPDGVPVVWIFADPLCHFSQRVVLDLKPYAAAGRLQLRVIPVNVISPQSVPAALVLLSEPPTAMVTKWFQPGIMQAGYDPAVSAKLIQNDVLFAGMSKGALNVTGVPELIWLSASGAHVQSGLPSNKVPDFIARLQN